MYRQEHGHNMPRLIGAAQTASFASKTTTFTSSTTFTAPPASTSVTYIVVAGGGGGGFYGGGGGAGGYRSSVPGESSGGGASAEPALTITAGSDIPVVVGAGAVATGAHGYWDNGNNSSFGPIASTGGGGGGSRFAYTNPEAPAGGSQNGADGGSGGGAGIWYGTGADGGAGTANQGYPSGNR